MRRAILLSIGLFGCTCGLAGGDTFSSGGNKFEIEFVDIPFSTNPTSGYGVVNYDYRMGKLEITNNQWNYFVADYGVVSGTPSDAYDSQSYYAGSLVPVNSISWYEAAQFTNWLNTSNGYQAAYKFTGIKGTSSYSLDIWDASDAWGGTNLYRHKDAYYFLPTEDEWVKAAYWNGTYLQTYATYGDSLPTEDVDTNYDLTYEYMAKPWDVGSGTKEINGTYDMMGNVWEWMESPYLTDDYRFDSDRVIRGGGCFSGETVLKSSHRGGNVPYNENNPRGFRVASVPEPTSLVLISLGGLALCRRRC